MSDKLDIIEPQLNQDSSEIKSTLQIFFVDGKTT